MEPKSRWRENVNDKDNFIVEEKKQEYKPHGVDVRIRRIVAYTGLILISLLCLFWMYILFVNATRSNGELKAGFTPIPSNHLLQNWLNLYQGALPIMNGLVNSLFVAVCSATACSYFASLAAFGFHIYEFKGKKWLFTFILMVMMIPQQVGTLGYIQMVDHLQLDDTFWALILPRIAVPVTFYYIIQYMKSTLPVSLIEAARLDGAGEMRIYHQIVVPLIKPAIVVQFIFEFVASWNNYFIPALVLHTDKKKTLPILIALLRSANYTEFDMGQIYMMIVFSILPVVVVYIFLSKQIIQGVTAGGEKG